MKKPKTPKEPADAVALRARQIADLAKLDEEENRRIKALFRGRSGGRAFRSSGRSGTASSTRASGGGFSGGGSYGSGGGRGGGGRGASLIP